MDELLQKIARYVAHPPLFSEEAYHTAKYCLLDSLGCAMLALHYPACTKLLGPVVPGIAVEEGCRIPGTNYILDPVAGAFNLGTMIRWLDYNDTWLAAEWGHPSDNIGGLLPLADYISRQHDKNGQTPLSLHDLLTAIIKAYEIQGVLALSNSYNQVGLDHVALVKIATATVATHMLGGSEQQIYDTLSQAFLDIGPLRTYRHAPNAGSRKSWAAGDATSRGIWLALLTMRGEKGYATPLSAPKWGVQDVLFKGHPLTLARPLGCYVMENILFKIAFPAEFHAQTAVEAAFKLHTALQGDIAQIAAITIKTHLSAIRIIDKTGPLKNPADRDHCLQYMVAVALLKGSLTADDYEDAAAQNPQIDQLRAKMHVEENTQFSQDYLSADKRSIANTVTVTTKAGAVHTATVEYPLGHRRRRQEALPLLMQKAQQNLGSRFPAAHVEKTLSFFEDAQGQNSPIDSLTELFTV